MATICVLDSKFADLEGGLEDIRSQHHLLRRCIELNSITVMDPKPDVIFAHATNSDKANEIRRVALELNIGTIVWISTSRETAARFVQERPPKGLREDHLDEDITVEYWDVCPCLAELVEKFGPKVPA